MPQVAGVEAEEGTEDRLTEDLTLPESLFTLTHDEILYKLK
jgi:hypothetical protein